jgi:hypothetical protein
VRTLPDGQRVYDGSLRDLVRHGVSEVKSSFMAGLHGLSSPRSSPRERALRESEPQTGRGAVHGSFTQAPGAAARRHDGLARQATDHGVYASSASMAEPAPGSVPLPRLPSPLQHVEGGAHSAPLAAGAHRAEAQSSPALLPGGGGGEGEGGGPGAGAMAFASSLLLGVRSGFRDVKDKVADASTRALGILPQPGYKPQTTGGRRARRTPRPC